MRKEKVGVYCNPEKLHAAKIKLAQERGTLTGIFETAIELFLMDALPDVDAVKADMETARAKAELTEDFLK